jgi:hypothetical protein
LIDYNDLTVIENRLAVRTVAQIAHEAVREASPESRVAGVMPGASGTSYVEILINLEGWDPDNSQITVGAFRNAGPAALKKQIVDSLQRRLHEAHN